MIHELRKIAKNIVRVVSGKTVHWEYSDRSGDDASRGLTPAEVDRIMLAANTGDVADLFRLAAELPEKNWDIFHALQTRQNAVLGCPWKIEPGDDSRAAKSAAEKLETELRAAGSLEELDSFHDLMCDLMRGLLPGVAVSEIVWGPGGKLLGFSSIDSKHLTLRDSRTPRLVTRDNSNGIELPRGKFIVHRLRVHGSDPVRGGLIRPLAWLHCFANVNVKDLLRFIERYGMPFAVAKVDKDAWDTELAKLKSLIRNFGPNGGGVFTRSTELELLQAANNTGDVYFRLLEYVGAAITKVVLGQTATAGDGGGWSNDGAQSQVRQDILESDCRWIENSVNTQICEIWNKFNSAENTPAPRLAIDSTPAEDIKQKYEAMKMRFDAMGVAIRAGLLTATAKLEEVVREVMELPELSTDSDALAEWKRTSGVKRPITLAETAKEQAPMAAPTSDPSRAAGAVPGTGTLPAALEAPLSVASALPQSDPSLSSAEGAVQTPSVVRTSKSIASGAVRRWLDPLQMQINAACDKQDAKAIADLAADPEAFFSNFDDSEVRAALEQNTLEAYARAKASSPSDPSHATAEPGALSGTGTLPAPSVVRTGGIQS